MSRRRWSRLSGSLEKRRYSITRLKHHNCDQTTHNAYHAWKEKILDYEIETERTATVSCEDWPLEKRRYSITRLKPGRRTSRMRSGWTWKEKILDYEIETWHVIPIPRLCLLLEKRRYSITRLKRLTNATHSLPIRMLEKRRYSITRLKHKEFDTVEAMFAETLKREDTRLRDWNNKRERRTPVNQIPWKEKILDYEIETESGFPSAYHKLSWKEKILDYEIETATINNPPKSRIWTWKEKILDYEIETNPNQLTRINLKLFLKREDTRLRDWNL